jgi:hypothetical protein
VTRIRLPVSGLELDVRQPCGADDLLLAEAAACDWLLTLTFMPLVARPVDGVEVDWGELTVTDADALLLLLRRRFVADAIRADVVCPSPACGERIEIAFAVGGYVAHHRPRRPRGVVPLPEPGWFGFADDEVSFRLPRCRDLVELAHADAPKRELVRRCVRPGTLRGKALRRVERAMEALAPRLSHELEAECPACRGSVVVDFDAQCFTVVELRQRALSVYADVHLLARTYHWSESEILALPRDRRIRYAELARSA